MSRIENRLRQRGLRFYTPGVLEYIDPQCPNAHIFFSFYKIVGLVLLRGRDRCWPAAR